MARLLIACREGSLPLVQWLAGLGVPINSGGNHGLTPLHVACMTGHLDVVQWLVVRCYGYFIPPPPLAPSRLSSAYFCAKACPSFRKSAGAAVMPVASRPGGATPLHVAAHSGQLPGAPYACAVLADAQWWSGSSDTAPIPTSRLLTARPHCTLPV